MPRPNDTQVQEYVVHDLLVVWLYIQGMSALPTQLKTCSRQIESRTLRVDLLLLRYCV